MANQSDMPDQEIALGKPAENPNAPAAAPDMNKYYYRPGTTEPELRPEFANAATALASAGETQTAAASESEESATKRGSLPDDFPHVELLRAAGITSYSKVKNLKGDYSTIDGIGEARAADIDEALKD